MFCGTCTQEVETGLGAGMLRRWLHDDPPHDVEYYSAFNSPPRKKVCTQCFEDVVRPVAIVRAGSAPSGSVDI